MRRVELLMSICRSLSCAAISRNALTIWHIMAGVLPQLSRSFPLISAWALRAGASLASEPDSSSKPASKSNAGRRLSVEPYIAISLDFNLFLTISLKDGGESKSTAASS